MKRYLPAIAAILLLISCGKKSDRVLLTSELNTKGTRHLVQYSQGIPTLLTFETFVGSGDKDTTSTDSLLHREIFRIQYDRDNKTALLTLQPVAEGPAANFRKYYFNDDELLVKITRFDDNREYTTDSVSYDYTTQTASFFDLVNKRVYELLYDVRMNIESQTEKRMGDNRVFHKTYFFYDASRNPFLASFEEGDELFSCFHVNNPGLFWNNASRPLFSSINNVQSFKEESGGEEKNGLFEYQYHNGLPVIQFGNDNVIYYKYGTFHAE